LGQGSKNGGKHTKSKNLEDRQNKNFYPTHFSNLNGDHIEKKLWHFEDHKVIGKGEKPCRKPQKSGMTFRWVLTSYHPQR
jgi:hypothetical protein